MIVSSTKHLTNLIPFGISCRFSKEGSVIRLYKIVEKGKSSVPVPVASFHDFSVYYKDTYDYSGLENSELIVKVKSTKSDKKGNFEKEFSLSHGYNDFMAFVSIIRAGPMLDSVGQELFDWLNKEEFPIKDAHLVRNKKQLLNVTPAFGIFKKDLVFTPNEFVIDSEGLDLEEEEFKSFIKHFPKPDEEVDLKELKKYLEVLHRYLEKDKTNIPSFIYCFSDVFRSVLFNNCRLKEYPYFVIESKHKSNLGKTSRGKLFTYLFTGLDGSKEPYNPEYLKDTYSRLRSIQFFNLPVLFDEFSQYSHQLAENFKSFGNNSKFNFKIGDIGGQNTKNRIVIRGACLFAVNQLNIRDENLRNRHITQNLENLENLENYNPGYEGIDEDYDYLLENSTLFMKYFWLNYQDFLSLVSIGSTKRENAKFEILNLGMRLMNFLFEKFNLKPIEFDVQEFLDTQETNTITINDELRNVIFDYIEKQTKVSGHKLGNWSLFDIKSLLGRRENNEFQVIDEYYNEIPQKIIDKAESLGIYVCKNDLNLLLTKKFCQTLERYSSKFKGLKVPRDLQNYFFKDECEIVSSTEEKKNISSFYGIQTSSKTGLLLYINTKKSKKKNEG